MNKDLIGIYDLTKEDINRIYERTFEIKDKDKKRILYTPLKNRSVALIFEKHSTRTRVSFEVAIYQLGGYPLFLSSKETQLDRGEPIKDFARVLSSYVDAIVMRTYSHEKIKEMARYASIPVINGLSDLLHPCQILSDIFTIIEKRGGYKGIKIAYVGDGNNIANSWIEAATRLNLNLSIASPKGYKPDREIVDRAYREGISKIEIFENPVEAVKDADVINTDVWTSMGMENEHKERIRIFKNYQVNKKLIKYAKEDVLIMHCLPAHRGEEITDDVMEGKHSIIFDQAANRLPVQKAILDLLINR